MASSERRTILLYSPGHDVSPSDYLVVRILLRFVNRVLYPVFLMHRRKDLWGPDGESALSSIRPRVTFFLVQPTSLILIASSMHVCTRIWSQIRSSSCPLMPGRVSALVNRYVPSDVSAHRGLMMDQVCVQRGVIFPHPAVAVDRWGLVGYGDATAPSGRVGAGRGT